MSVSSANHVRNTWRALIEIFGPQWPKTFGDVPTGAWLAALEELSYEQIERGVRYYATQAATPRAYPPNLPEFRFRCLGIPDKPASINRAIDGDTSTEFLTALVGSVPEYDRRTLATKALYFRFDANYDRIVERVLSGDAPRLPPPRPQSYDADPTNTSHLPPQDGLDGQPTTVGDGRQILKSATQLLHEAHRKAQPDYDRLPGESDDDWTARLANLRTEIVARGRAKAGLARKGATSPTGAERRPDFAWFAEQAAKKAASANHAPRHATSGS